MKKSSTAVIAVSLIVTFVSACATRQAQQSINTWNEQFALVANAIDSANLQLINRCTKAEDTLRELLTAQAVVPNGARHVIASMITSKPAIDDQPKTGQRRASETG